MKTLKSTLVFCLFCCFFSSLTGQNLNCPDTVFITCGQGIIPAAGANIGFPLSNTDNLLPDPNDPNYDADFGGPWIATGLGPNNEDLTLRFTDLVTSPNCADAFSQLITRQWELVSSNGTLESCQQVIARPRLSLSQIQFPLNFDGVTLPVLQCKFVAGGVEESADNASCGPTTLYWNALPPGHPYQGHPSPFDGEKWPCGEVKHFGTGAPVTCDDIQSTFEDLRIPCDPGDPNGCYKLLRTFTVLDWCTGNVRTHNQIIKVESETRPSIVPLPDATLAVNFPATCTATYLVPNTTVDGDCDGNTTNYTVSSSAGFVTNPSGTDWLVNELPVGIHDIIFTPIGCCGVGIPDTMKLTVTDGVAPVAVCDEETIVSLSGQGNATVFASTFDDGSFDACSNQVWFRILRQSERDANNDGEEGTVADGDWVANSCNGLSGDDDLRTSAPYQGAQAYFDNKVNFCVEDVTNNTIFVVLRVFDVDPSPYTFGAQFPGLLPNGADPNDYAGVLPEAMAPGGALEGRYSDCLVQVTVEDKLPPFVVAPPNVTITCDYMLDFDSANPDDFADQFDLQFGEVVTGPNANDPTSRDSIIVNDRVCPAHPRFAEYAPQDIFADPCYDDTYDIFWGFDGYAIDNSNQVTLDQSIVSDLSCGLGDIRRTWIAMDAEGNVSNTAVQIITIINCQDFYVPEVCWRFTQGDVGSCDLVNSNSGLEYLIKKVEWPCDLEIIECDPTQIGSLDPDDLVVNFDQDRQPRVHDDGCSLIAVTYEDTVFPGNDPNELSMVHREWTMINWCLFELGITPYQWSWVQVIRILGNSNPTLSCNANVNVSLDANCQATVTPEMILEGSNSCIDNYEVSIYENAIDPNNLIEQPLNSSQIGLDLIAVVTDPVSGNFCFGSIELGGGFGASLSLSTVEIINAGCGGASGSITVQVSCGTPAYTLDWSNGVTQTGDGPTFELSDLSGGDYSVTVTDAAGNTIVGGNYFVDQSSASLTATILSSCALGTASNGGLSANVSGGEEPYDYQWSNGGTTLEIGGLAAGDYSLTVTDALGCILVTTATVEAVDAQVTQNDFSICRGETVQFEIESSLSLDYFWAPGEDLSCIDCPNPMANPDESTVFLVIVSDPATGCVTVDEFNVEVDSSCVWPGDTNVDKVVNQFDLLNIGLGFGANGPARANATSDWVPQPAFDWNQSTPLSNTNYKHIDANGDGTINFSDALVIAFNWGEEHNFVGEEEEASRSIMALDAPFYIKPDTLIESQIVALPVILGSDEFPVDELYGLAFSITYDSSMVKQGSITFKADNSWLGTIDDDMISLHQNHFSPGRLDIGITRTDQINRGGNGEIGQLFITIEDDVLFQNNEDGNRSLDALLHLRIENVRAITVEEEEMSFAIIDTFAVINKNITSTTSLSATQQVEVFPNPASNHVNFLHQGSSTKAIQVRIYDLLGREVMRFRLPENATHQINTTQMEQGLYTYTIHVGDQSLKNGKLIIRHP
ncbi:MAG: T9SS type A sorting domain-containing protein [Bacteroidota bacterium]